jgi:hypothetical protein
VEALSAEPGELFRGAELYEFDEGEPIREVRNYYAAPRAPGQ